MKFRLDNPEVHGGGLGPVTRSTHQVERLPWSLRRLLTFFTEIENWPVLAISSGGLLIVQVLLSFLPFGKEKSKDANCPASQKGFWPDDGGKLKKKVIMSAVSLRRSAHLRVTLELPGCSSGL